ncbi:hypothetical protein M9Y10_041987 [Tritrichomonas musculus]|uniref:Protein kinase domain-containing protein n=1 Tax=Tritrichomonas musculus TaxID=1915356 RepID=A0ABR2K5X8_9EUKA
MEGIFINEEQIRSFLQNAPIRYTISSKIKECEYETIAAYLLQKSYIESRIDRVENINELSHPPAKIPDMKMDDFIDIYLLGIGSCGYAYLTYNYKEEKLFAIKKQTGSDLENQKLQSREILNYETFCHPFLPRYYGTPDGKSVVIDFIDGCTLKNIKQLNLDFFEKIIIIMEILLTIQYFHSQKYIYRDLKPNNVIIDQNRNAIIIDFDRIIFDTENKGEKTTADLGSEFFIAPEISFKKQFSTKADIYSIGKLIYYIIKEEEPKSSSFIFDPEHFEISEITELSVECTKDEPDERPEISELIVKLMKYFTKNIAKFESNNLLMNKFLKIIDNSKSSDIIEKEVENIYSTISNISNIFNSFQQSSEGELVSLSRDIDKAIHYYSLAANQNNSYAQFNLGLIYYYGVGTSLSIEKAIYYFTLAAYQNQSDAQFYLGSIYYEGLYVTSDIDKAIHYFREASSFNHSRAKNNLGIIRKTGKGLPANICNSVEYFEEAIRQKGDEVAMFNLAHIHLYEEFHKSNLDKAIELLVKPAIKEIEFSFDLLCLAVIKKYEVLNESEIEECFEKIDKEGGRLLAYHVCGEIKFQQIQDPNYYEKTYNKLKDIKLVYYGDKIENQTEKQKIEYIDPRPKINELFYEGLGNI